MLDGYGDHLGAAERGMGADAPFFYLSVCSGIEAASVAWHPLGWQLAGVAEIDPACANLLSRRWGAGRPQFMPDPDAVSPLEGKKRRAAIKAVARIPEVGRVPNFGDLESYRRWDVGADVDLLVGGTPCQPFSVAGLRQGLDDPRGNLALVFLGLVERLRPRWVVWENVPGVLSSNKGRDFGAFLGGLGQLGYGWSYRVLDAQYVRTLRFVGAVPQRRRRVFVVGYLGDWRPPAAVFFDAQSLRGDPPPSREARQGSARGFEIGPSGGGFTDLSPTLDARCKDVPIRNQLGAGVLHAADYIPEICNALAARDYKQPRAEDGVAIIPVAGPLTAGMGKSSARMPHEQGALVPIAFDCKGSEVETRAEGAAPTLRAMTHSGSHANGGRQIAVALAFQNRARGDDGRGYDREPAVSIEVCGTLDTVKPHSVALPWAVRRLTPVECERLQGFPDGYTDVPFLRNLTPDGVRYKQLGNSMAVNAMDWLGHRIDLVERILRGLAK